MTDHAIAAGLRAFGMGDPDLAAWQASGLPEVAFGDWLTDRVARRPTGDRARAVYGADDTHDFARRAILEALALRPGDHLLDVGCGGGLLLRDALATGATATGIDHSPEMVDLARERAPEAEVRHASAEELPYADGRFTAVSMCAVFLFFREPTVVLTDARRVLADGGRLAVYTPGPQLRGTPAAPEPLAAHAHFYEDEALAALARGAGFGSVVVTDNDGAQLLTGAA